MKFNILYIILFIESVYFGFILIQIIDLTKDQLKGLYMERNNC